MIENERAILTVQNLPSVDFNSFGNYDNGLI